MINACADPTTSDYDGVMCARARGRSRSKWGSLRLRVIVTRRAREDIYGPIVNFAPTRRAGEKKLETRLRTARQNGSPRVLPCRLNKHARGYRSRRWKYYIMCGRRTHSFVNGVARSRRVIKFVSLFSFLFFFVFFFFSSLPDRRRGSIYKTPSERCPTCAARAQ